MRKKPEILATRSVARTKLFRIEEVDLRFSNGEERTYERLGSRGIAAVMIVPMLDDDQVILVREYAVGTDRYELGLPKGLVETDEEVLAAADRELKEEVGYGANKLTFLKTMSAAPGYMGAGMRTILAQDLYPCKLPGDEPEEIEVVIERLSNLPELIQREDLSEARTIAALFWAREFIFNKG